MTRAISWNRRFSLLFALAGAGLLVAGSWIQLKAVTAQWLLHDAWQQTVNQGGQHRPWPWADHWPVARLAVPEHGVDQVVLAGDAGNVLAFAPGHNSRSAAPGQRGTVIISGHRDTHFRFLQQLQPGQSVQLDNGSDTRDYRIMQARVVDATRTSIDLSSGLDHLLLVTCYPFDSPVAGGPLRYVVSAVPETRF